MSGTLLDLDLPRSWPVELLGYLDEHHDLFRGWDDGQGQGSAETFDHAVYGLRRALQPYQILAWHCTRLTDAEAEVIRRNGMQLPDAEMLASRIDSLVKTGLTTPDIARRLSPRIKLVKSAAPERSASAFFLRETLARTESVDSFVTGVARRYTFATRTIQSRHLPSAALVLHAS